MLAWAAWQRLVHCGTPRSAAKDGLRLESHKIQRLLKTHAAVHSPLRCPSGAVFRSIFTGFLHMRTKSVLRIIVVFDCLLPLTFPYSVPYRRCRGKMPRSLPPLFSRHCSIWSTAKCRTSVLFDLRIKGLGHSASSLRGRLFL